MQEDIICSSQLLPHKVFDFQGTTVSRRASSPSGMGAPQEGPAKPLTYYVPLHPTEMGS